MLTLLKLLIDEFIAERDENATATLLDIGKELMDDSSDGGVDSKLHAFNILLNLDVHINMMSASAIYENGATAWVLVFLLTFRRSQCSALCRNQRTAHKLPERTAFCDAASRG